MKRLLMVILALALVVAACGDDDASDVETLGEACELGETDGDLNLYNWTEYIPTGSVAEEAEVTDLLAAFEDEFGVNVLLTEYDDNETMLDGAVRASFIKPMRSVPPAFGSAPATLLRTSRASSVEAGR